MSVAVLTFVSLRPRNKNSLNKIHKPFDNSNTKLNEYILKKWTYNMYLLSTAIAISLLQDGIRRNLVANAEVITSQTTLSILVITSQSTLSRFSNVITCPWTLSKFINIITIPSGLNQYLYHTCVGVFAPVTGIES